MNTGPMNTGQDLDATLMALMRLPKAGTGIGLHRMAWLLEPLLSNPWGRELSCLKVTGSNGKGSVARLAAGLLGELGFKAGLYTSPHVLDFSERVVVGDQPISRPDLASAVAWFEARRADYAALHPGDAFGAFEAFTGLAMRHFAQASVEALVLEAGIGGRYDSTRAAPGQVVALTSLDLEHTEILGKSLEEIAFDKADLCPDGGTLVIGALDPEVRRRLEAYARARRLTLVPYQAVGTIHRVRYADGRMRVDLTLEGERLDAVAWALAGEHQVVNALVAAGLVRAWLCARGAEIPPARLAQAFVRAVGAARWPGRLERVHDDPLVIVDVGHTPDAIAHMLAALPGLVEGRRLLLVTGVSANKNAEAILDQLAGAADAILCTRAHHRGSEPERILAIARARRPDLAIRQAPTIEAAMAEALAWARAENLAVLVAGGLFLAIEAKVALAGRNPRDLRFF